MRPATDVLAHFIVHQRVTRHIRSRGITVVGLAAPRRASVDYETLDGAWKASGVDVAEVNLGGRVSECRVRNRLDKRLLLVEGEELRGAKQNRVVNASILLDRQSESVVPVSCIERGRWSYVGHAFEKGTRAHGSLLYALKSSVTASLRSSAAYVSDQMAVWDEADLSLSATQVSSPTSSLADAYSERQGELDKFVEEFRHLESSSGFAVFDDGELVSMDLFDRPATFESLKERLLEGVGFEVLFRRSRRPPAAPSGLPREPDVEAWLDRVASLDATVHRGVGMGESVRMASGNLVASALVADGEVLHFGLVSRAATPD